MAHPRSPRVCAAHFDTRMLVTSNGWFGGGGDITPMFPERAEAQADAADFHAALRGACDRYRPDAYEEYKAWCDRYFFLPHRNEPRGLGGILTGWTAATSRATSPSCAMSGGVSGLLPRAGAPAHGRKLDRGGARGAALSTRALCRIQPAA